MVVADPTTAPDKARRKSAEAERLFELAESYTRPARIDGHVIAVGGMTIEERMIVGGRRHPAQITRDIRARLG